MDIKKNWFTYFALVAYEFFMVLAIIFGIDTLAKDRTFSFLIYAGAIAIAAVLPAVLLIFSKLGSLINIRTLLKKSKKSSIIIETVLAVIILASGTFIRVLSIQKMNIAPSSDFNTYYQVGELLSKGTLAVNGKGLCNYIACFPHVIGFPFFLSLLFKITGVNYIAGLYMNLVASIISMFLSYRIARMIGGRVAGIVTLTLFAFWPSMIIYSTLLASEPMFTMLMLLAIYILTFMFYYPAFSGKISVSIILSLLLGIVLAISSAVRPMGLILLLASIMVLLCCNKKFGAQLRNKVGVFKTAVCKGWFRILLMVVAYLLTSTIISGSVIMTIEKKTPSQTASFGYNLLVGVNKESHGTWNQADADLLNNTFEKTDSAEAAHIACRDKAMARIKSDPVGTCNLFFDKYSSLWGNDDYGVYWNTLFLGQQNKLTDNMTNVFKKIQVSNNIVYLVTLLFAALSGLFLWRKKEGNAALVLILFFMGTAILQMVVESQNRYHYDVLPLFMILAGFTVAEILRAGEKKKKEETAPEIKEIYESMLEAAATTPQYTDASHFDINKAINEGHIKVVVTETYKEKEPENNKD